jgi:hypothetical protein
MLKVLIIYIYIYIFQLEGYTNPNKKDLIYKLHKTIYGLKKSSREWYKRINEYLGWCGFKNSGADPNIYIKTLGEKFIVLALYLDDINLITNDPIGLLLTTKVQLKTEFRMINMNVLTYILGIQITINKKSRKIHIC